MKKTMAAGCLAAWMVAVSAVQAQRIEPIIRTSVPVEVGKTAEGVPLILEDVKREENGTNTVCTATVRAAEWHATTNIFLVPFGDKLVGLSAEMEQALAQAVSPICEIEYGANTDSPLALRILRVHRDSREILGARGEGRFPTKEKMSAFFRESLIPELAKRKAQLVERPRNKPLVVYSYQHPNVGKMIVETASGRNLDGTFTVVVALSSAPPSAASTMPK